MWKSEKWTSSHAMYEGHRSLIRGTQRSAEIDWLTAYEDHRAWVKGMWSLAEMD